MATGTLSMPLFDRLTADDEDPLFYTKEEWIQSIEREVERILNTRQSAQISTYGLSDFHEAANLSQWGTIAQNCQNAIRQFEPRLTRVRVSVDRFDRHQQQLYLNIQGVACAGDMERPLTFMTCITTNR